MKANQTRVDWKNIAGLRDVLVHAYFRIDDEILWDIITTKVEDLKDGVEKMIA